MSLREPPDPPEYKVGQVWKDRRAMPTSVFMVLRVYAKDYADGSAIRVVGALAAGDGYLDTERDLDARSAAKMFPHLLFEPPETPDPDANK